MAGGSSGESARARKARRRRVQGAALSGGAMLAGQLATATPAHAATITVNTLADTVAPDGFTSLREAVSASNSSTGTTDLINFSVTGDIQLIGTDLDVTDDVTIDGPGPALLRVHGTASSRVFDVFYAGGPIAVTISDLTVMDGTAGLADGGGGIYVYDEALTLDDVVITENTAPSGGGVLAVDATLIISDSIISENSVLYLGGGVTSDDTDLTITGTQFIHNTFDPEGRGGGGGLAVVGDDGGSATITGSVFDDNQAPGGAGIELNAVNTPASITGSTLIGNDAGFTGGGLAMDVVNDDPADVVTITDSTISGNTAAYGGGGGISFYGPYRGSSRLRIDRSTISGNDGGEGGGVLISNGFDEIDYDVTHSVTISDSTISGNRAVGFDQPGYDNDLAGAGGGVLVALTNSGDTYGGVDTLAVTLANSTIAANTAVTLGGGVFELIDDSTITLDHTIVGDNTAGYGGDVVGSVNANWSLIESLDGLSFVGANNITGSDPQLSPLANNGGPTLTQMIAPTSPAHNGGNPAFGAVPAVDQRGRPRISGTKIDIGSVERQTSLPAVVNSSVNWRLRDRLSTGPANLPTFSLSASPLVPVMGDWDGDGDKTPGYFKGGVFTLSNNLNGTGPLVTFTFGQVNGFPVAGNWDGDTDDEVAVFRNGTWEVRKTTTPGDPSLFTPNFVFGTGVWPTTTPVAGDWDGNGTDGIGYYNGNGAAIGTWTLRQTATSGGVSAGTFNYEPGTPAAGYPVVGDWDGNKTDTVGTKTGPTWNLRNANSAGAADISFDFTVVAANDLPLVWQYGIGP